MHEQEQLHLDTEAEKKAFLQQIIDDDQSVRGPKGSEIMLGYGQKSKEYRAWIDQQIAQDEINLAKVEKYLDQYGYPPKEWGSDITTAPWIVIHHGQSYEARERNFPVIYQAYLDGKIDDGAITFYLGRMYHFKYGERLDMESPYTTASEIDTLLKALSLSVQN